MLRMQAFKFEISPDGKQERDMRNFSGACRFVFNKALALQKENYEAGGQFITYVSMAKQLTAWRSSPETLWLSEAPYHSLQQALKDLDRAYKNFFQGRTQFPRFRKKDSRNSFRYPDPQQIKLDQKNSRIFLPKLGWVRYRKSRVVIGKLRNVTVSNKGTKWFISIQIEQEVETPVSQATTAIGVDVGISRFATLSNGNYIAPVNSLRKHKKRLAKYQRRMSRKVKFSKNWKKAKTKVQKVHTDISNARQDFLHKATTAISKSHALVCVEDLQICHMSKSSSGTLKEPGRMVRQKSGLNRSILDQSWGMFRRQLEYKLKWNGGLLLAVPPEYTSQTCPDCNYVSKDNRKTQAEFECVCCHYKNHADVVGAINVLERGYRLLARGEMASLSRSKKREPAEAKSVSL